MPVIDEQPCGAAIDRMKPPEKTITFSGRFLFPKTPSPENRILGAPCGMTRIGWRQTIPQKDESPSGGGKEWHTGVKDDLRVERNQRTGRGESISPTGDSDENRPKSVCGSVCTLRFRGPERPQCLRAVGLRPDLTSDRMQPYAPYALPLKGKRPKKVQLPKEVHKVHTASLMFAQPYCQADSCLRAKSA